VTYTIKVCNGHNIDNTDFNFIYDSADKVNQIYGNKFQWEQFKIIFFAENHRLTICYRDQKPVGFMAATLIKSFFDANCVLLRQELLFALPNSRAANLLLKDFIDFGKLNANHILTTIGKKTNIKPKSLERLGFEELEVRYRLEVK
jgi:hypothetical protein